MVLNNYPNDAIDYTKIKETLKMMKTTQDKDQFITHAKEYQTYIDVFKDTVKKIENNNELKKDNLKCIKEYTKIA
jgi:spore germination protein YaaH